MNADRDEPRLAAPGIDDILELGGIDRASNANVRNAVLEAMRKAAEKRVAGVIENKRRRYYGHAAELVAACAGLDPTPETSKWVASIRAKYRRYPALQRELSNHLGRA